MSKNKPQIYDGVPGEKILKNRIYKVMLRYPGMNNVEIANQIGVSPDTVSYHKKSIINGIDMTLAKYIVEVFMQDYQMSADAMKLQLGDIQNLINETREDLDSGIKFVEDGEDVPLDTLEKAVLRRDIASLEKQKTDVWIKIVTMARQSEAIELMNLLRKKVIKLPDEVVETLEKKIEEVPDRIRSGVGVRFEP